MMDWAGSNGKIIESHKAFGIMGIINVTPDSFYDGANFANPDVALAHGRALLARGADILDIGAESTRPGAAAVEPGEEWRRLEPVLKGFAYLMPGCQISVDTRNAATAARALGIGAPIVNDVSGLAHDPAMLDVLAQYKPGYVLTHSKGDPQTMQDCPDYDDVVEEIKKFFEYSLNKLIKNGLPENRIALDPGIGFGKTLEHNLEILRRMGEFLIFGRPLLAGVSMKSFLGKLLGLPVQDRGEATAIISALLYQKGVKWHRVHDVISNKMALELADALKT